MLLNHRFRLSETRKRWFCNRSTPRMLLTLDCLFRIEIELVTIKLLYVKFIFFIMIFSRGVPCFAADYTCPVWCCRLIICCFVFDYFYTYIYIYCNISQYIYILSFVCLIVRSQIMLYSCQVTLHSVSLAVHNVCTHGDGLISFSNLCFLPAEKPEEAFYELFSVQTRQWKQDSQRMTNAFWEHNTAQWEVLGTYGWQFKVNPHEMVTFTAEFLCHPIMLESLWGLVMCQ